MGSATRLRAIATLGMIVGCGGGAAIDGVDDPGTEVDELRLRGSSGTLSFAGCAPSAGEVRVVARSLAVTLPGRRTASVGDSVSRVSPRTIPGVVLPTRDPRMFRYTFPVLPTGAYQLSVEVIAPSCAGAIWRGPTAAAFVAGQHDLRFEAMVPRTRVGVLRPGDAARVAFAADTVPLDAAQGATTRNLLIETTLPRQTAYELQVSTERPRAGGPLHCVETGGVVYRERLTLRPGGAAVVPFDLARALRGSGLPSVSDTPGEVASVRASPLVTEYRRGRPLFLRVVPLGAECSPGSLGGSSFVVVRVPFAQVPDSTVRQVRANLTFEGRYEPGSQVPRFTPTPGTECFQAVTAHTLPLMPGLANGFDSFINDPLGALLVMTEQRPAGSTIPAGTIFCIAPTSGGGGGGIGGTFGDLITGAVDGAAWAVNSAAAVYESMQQAVVAGVASALVASGVGCDADCRAVLTTALKTGLTAMGVPPTLPNFDALMDQGVDYLAASVAQQTNLPPEVARAAVLAVIDEMKSHPGPSSPANVSWAVLADPGLPETTRLTVGVPPGWLDTPGELGVSSAPFTDASFFVPSGYGVWTLPIVHQPNLTGIAAPGPVSTPLGPVTIAYTATYLRYWYFIQWRAQRYAASCVFMQYRVYSSDATTPTAAPVLRANTAGTWSTPSMTNLCL